jgi:hypothetical protein
MNIQPVLNFIEFLIKILILYTESSRGQHGRDRMVD